MTNEKASKRKLDHDNLLALKLNESAEILDINGEPKAKRRLFDLGVTRGTTIKALYKSPYGDPIAYLVRNSVIALRSEDSINILIRTKGTD